MSRFPSFAAVVMLGFAASACAPTTNGLTADNNPSLSSVHQPIVQRTDYVLDVANPGGGLAPSELQRLHGWLDSIGASYGDRLSVDEPAGYADPAAHQDLANVATDRGFVLADAPPVLGGSVSPGTVRVIVSRAVASVPGCPDWTRSEANIPNERTSPNYGCSTNSNLAAMVANPEDLVVGQTGNHQGSATTARRAVRTYRDRPSTGAGTLQSTSARNQ